MEKFDPLQLIPEEFRPKDLRCPGCGATFEKIEVNCDVNARIVHYNPRMFASMLAFLAEPEDKAEAYAYAETVPFKNETKMISGGATYEVIAGDETHGARWDSGRCFGYTCPEIKP